MILTLVPPALPPLHKGLGLERRPAAAGIRPFQSAKFTANGIFTAQRTGWYRVACVGGGGGGAFNGGGGGGSGLLVADEVLLEAGQDVTIVIGSGGIGGVDSVGGWGQERNGNPGQPTRFGNLIQAPGGGGGWRVDRGAAISDGGNGLAGGGSSQSEAGAIAGLNTSNSFGQGVVIVEAILRDIVSWVLEAGAGGQPDLVNGGAGGGGGLRVDDDAVTGGDAPNGGGGGEGYGAGGGGDAANTSAGSGVSGVCLVEGVIK